jgi:predicted amidophosphoribosyltransferase
MERPRSEGRLANGCRVVAPWAYEGAGRALVLALKLDGLRPAAAPLVDAMCEESRQRGLRAEVVTWVPARRVDIRRRGFDHAEMLARGAAKLLGLPCAPLLRSAGRRLDQTALSAAKRRANLAGAFEARPATRSVVVVDDLVTTGATAQACAAALQAAGAAEVEVLVPCRA